MTYCCGVLVRDGLVMIADTRNHIAGLDQRLDLSQTAYLQQTRRPHHGGRRAPAIWRSASRCLSTRDPKGLKIRIPATSKPWLKRADHVPGGAADRPGDPRGHTPPKARRGSPRTSIFDVSVLFGGQNQGPRGCGCSWSTRPAISSNATPTRPICRSGEHKYGKPGARPRHALRRRIV